MTKLTITIDRGPDAKPDECGECGLQLDFSRPFSGRAECVAFRGEYSPFTPLLRNARGMLERCEACIAAEKGNGNGRV